MPNIPNQCIPSGAYKKKSEVRVQDKFFLIYTA